jgi:hypothetical protein
MIAEFIRLPARPDRIIMMTVFACSILAGWAMLPGENERVAMLERDGHSREALMILEQQVTGGDKRYRTLHQLLALYENEGNISKARDVIEQMSKERPRDALLKRRLAKFYKNNNAGPEYIAAMQELIDLRYSEPICRELIGWLRFKGESAAEQATLQHCRQKGYRRAEDLSRLAEFVAADGDAAQAAGLLKSIDDLKRLKELRERLQLLSLLSELDQPKEAERRVLRWIRANRDDGAMAVNLIDHLARSKHPESAYEVAKDGGIPGDSISLTVAERLLEKSQNGAALLYLRGWLDRAKTVDADTAIRFVDAALGVGDPQLALKGARQFGYVLLPQRSLEKIGDGLEQVQATIEASEVRAVIAGVVPPLPSTVASAQPQDASGQPPAAADTTVEAGAETTSRVRSILLVDPLDGWRRSLFAAMTGDAQRRVGAQFVGPKAPPLHAGRHFTSHSRGRDSHAEHQSFNPKVFKKTSRILQRTKKFTALKAKRRSVKKSTENLPFVEQQGNGPASGKPKAGGKPKP